LGSIPFTLHGADALTDSPPDLWLDANDPDQGCKCAVNPNI
jgi:hypothetical protein